MGFLVPRNRMAIYCRNPMYNSCNVQKTFLVTIDNRFWVGYNTDRWKWNWGRNLLDDVLGHILRSNFYARLMFCRKRNRFSDRSAKGRSRNKKGVYPIMKKVLAVVLALALTLSMVSLAVAEGKVGVAMPTQSLQRWNQDGENMKAQLEAAGFEVDLQYANNEVATQVSQLENMITNGAQVLVVASIDGSALGTVLATAKEAGIPIIAYDRLLTDTDAVDYYTTFDNYKVGQIQGQYIVDKFDLSNEAVTGPFTIEFTAGSPDDNNAGLFFNGAYDTLKPYLDSGKLVCVSGQLDFETVATPAWKSETSQARMENILSSYYGDALTGGQTLDICLCSNDSTALGVTNALVNAGFTAENIPVITGQDCDIANTKNMIKGLQAMSVFKDTRDLAAQTVTMVSDILAGKTPETNGVYDNKVKEVPSFNCTPVFADATNYQTLLIDSGYYTADQLAD